MFPKVKRYSKKKNILKKWSFQIRVFLTIREKFRQIVVSKKKKEEKNQKETIHFCTTFKNISFWLRKKRI